jgi:hypothetical protein
LGAKTVEFVPCYTPSLRNETAELKDGASVYPNPNNRTFWIKTNQESAISIRIFNAFGALMPCAVTPNPSESTHLIELPQHYPVGYYTLRIQTASNIYYRKILVQ